jgi:hypothetical protein
MSEYKEELVNAVIEMIKQDLPHDWSCLYDLLYYNVDENTLKNIYPIICQRSKCNGYILRRNRNAC